MIGGLSGCLGGGNSGSSATLTLSAEATNVERSATLYVTASGGSSPYSYFIASGGGSIGSSSGYYRAPSSDASVQLGVEDATGEVAYLNLAVSSDEEDDDYDTYDGTYPSLSLETASLLSGESLTLSTSGGTTPYTYTVSSGNGSFSGATFTAGNVTESVVVRVTDASGYTDDATISVLALTTLGATSQVWVDTQVGVTFDAHASSLDGEEAPAELVFFGTGSGTDNAALAASGTSCQVGGGADILAPCAIRIPLTNFDRTNAVGRAYKGTVEITGRGATASFEFCVRPSEPTRAYVRWTQSASLAYRSLAYNLADRTLLGGRSLRSAYNLVDATSGAGYAALRVSGAAYVAGTACGSSFSSTHYVEASQ